jgi:hypothetical protein
VAWKIFYSLFQSDSERELQYMMQRLATRDEMNEVWVELKRFEEVTPSILIAATILTWLSSMRGQPIGPGSAPTTGPSERDLASWTRAAEDYMRALDPTIRAGGGITDATLTELNRVVAFLERRAAYIDQLVNIAPPPRKARARNAHHIAFVNRMCERLWQPAGRRPYTLIAILTNVAFDVQDNEWDADRVKHCYRSRSRRN